MSDTIGLVDYGGGNLQSVLNVVTHLGYEAKLVTAPQHLEQVDKLLFPGVGSYGDCVDALDRQEIREPMVEWIRADRPFFGICLGYQVLFETSEESPGARGLGVFPGHVRRFANSPGEKVPHMGWNEVIPVDGHHALWRGLPEPLYLYFVHSYYPVPAQQEIVSSTTDYIGSFASSVTSGRLFACQFHPERSQDAGLALMKNFLEL